MIEEKKTITAPVLILYTGGTIGMTPGTQGLQPTTGFETQIRAAQTLRDQTWMPPWMYMEIDPPIDSANMTQQHWLLMCDVIVQMVARGECSGILILHGTDTLAYTAAALNFLLLGLPVPVCVTGAMQPASTPGTDAWNNLFGALHWLHTAQAGGVYVVFDGKILPGIQTTKRFSHRQDAFVAMRPKVEIHGVETYGIAHPAQWEREEFMDRLDYRVVRKPVPLAVLSLYPGMDADVLNALLATGAQGVVMELYGSGTGPVDNARFLEGLRVAHRRGVIIVGISQCPSGRVDSTQYAAASRLFQTGVLPGGSMTREAALGKLFGLLGAGLSVEQVKQYWSLDLCGEWGKPERLC